MVSAGDSDCATTTPWPGATTEDGRTTISLGTSLIFSLIASWIGFGRGLRAPGSLGLTITSFLGLVNFPTTLFQSHLF